MDFKFELLKKESVGSIELREKVRVSDPCYGIDTWCAGTLENVLPGTYQCFTQKVDQGGWEVRIASIEVRHENYLSVEPTEVQDIDVGVDSGQAGIYDLDYFIKAREDKNGKDEWYDRVCDITDEYIKNPNHVPFNQSSYWKPEFEKVEFVRNATKSNLSPINQMLAFGEEITWELEDEYFDAKMSYVTSIEGMEKVFSFAAATLDNKCLVSSSGDGDGSYTCLVGRNDEGQIVSIKIDYYYRYEEEEE